MRLGIREVLAPADLGEFSFRPQQGFSRAVFVNSRAHAARPRAGPRGQHAAARRGRIGRAGGGRHRGGPAGHHAARRPRSAGSGASGAGRPGGGVDGGAAERRRRRRRARRDRGRRLGRAARPDLSGQRDPAGRARHAVLAGDRAGSRVAGRRPAGRRGVRRGGSTRPRPGRGRRPGRRTGRAARRGDPARRRPARWRRPGSRTGRAARRRGGADRPCRRRRGGRRGTAADLAEHVDGRRSRGGARRYGDPAVLPVGRGGRAGHRDRRFPGGRGGADGGAGRRPGPRAGVPRHHRGHGPVRLGPAVPHRPRPRAPEGRGLLGRVSDRVEGVHRPRGRPAALGLPVGTGDLAAGLSAGRGLGPRGGGPSATRSGPGSIPSGPASSSIPPATSPSRRRPG